MASVDDVGIHYFRRYRGRLLGLALAIIATDDDRLPALAGYRAICCHWNCRHYCVLLRTMPSVIVATAIPPQTDRVTSVTMTTAPSPYWLRVTIALVMVLITCVVMVPLWRLNHGFAQNELRPWIEELETRRRQLSRD